MNPIAQLVKWSGQYQGQGVNHDKEDFIGKLKLIPILKGKGIEISYTATGHDGTCYHEENTIISTDFNGNIKMWNLNSNSPGMTELELKTVDKNMIFKLGDINDRRSFREEIKIELEIDSIGYHYSWGLPGGDFSYRSGLKMTKA